MADQNIRTLVRKFQAGDTSAAAGLVSAMLRAQEILSAVAQLDPSLQQALAPSLVSEGLRDEIQAALAEGISANEIAQEIDASEIASEIDTYDIMSNLDYTDLASELDYSDLASHIDYSSVEVDYDELAESVESRVADHIDYNTLAQAVLDNPDFQSMLDEKIADAIADATE